MNLGDHVGDAPQAVAHNRARLAAALHGITPGTRPVFLNQVHGTDCAQLPQTTPDGTRWDAAVCTAPGAACTIMVADCLPVLFTDTQGRAVGAAHAGWRGLAGGVLEALLTQFVAPRQIDIAQNAMKKIAAQSEIDPGAVLAWLGPCIGPTAFEVGQEVHDAFCAADAGAGRYFTACGHGKFFADLPGLARRRLTALGVFRIYGNDGSDAWCTVRQASRFFSHRRDGRRAGAGDGLGVVGTGRMAACIWLS